MAAELSPQQKFTIDVDFATGAVELHGPPPFDMRGMWDYALAEARRILDTVYARRFSHVKNDPNSGIVGADATVLHKLDRANRNARS